MVGGAESTWDCLEALGVSRSPFSAGMQRLAGAFLRLGLR